jgi:hypothetical protein
MLEFSKKGCEKCKSMQELVADDKIDLNKIQELVDDNVIELYAGNCYPKELSNHMNEGKHYTMNTYYHCTECDSYYYLGFCLYGRPIIKKVNHGDAENSALRLEWGFVGTYFSQKVDMNNI